MAASSKTASARSETKLVQELADILDKSGLAELEFETDAVAIRLSRVTGAAPVVAPAPVVTALTATPASANSCFAWYSCMFMCIVGGEKELDCHGFASNQAYSKKKNLKRPKSWRMGIHCKYRGVKTS